MNKCQVCVENFNKSKNTRVLCPFCPFDACSACNERYLCENSQDAHCMSCHKGWTREILASQFSKKFISKSYKAHREEVLLNREKSLMPATQIYVELELRLRRLREKLEEYRSRLATEHLTWMGILTKPLEDGNEFEGNIERMRLGHEQRKIYDSVQIDVEYIEWTINTIANRKTSGISERRQFVRACPFENCKGFLSTAWKCGLCNHFTCSACHEIKDTEHECDLGNLATAQLLARDSRPCPSCASVIFKIDGCDQMFCTQCHTAFSWKTGHIETGVVHNPHYYEFTRLNGVLPRAHGDIPCGGMPDIYRLGLVRGQPHYRELLSAHRSWGHCQYHLIPKYTVNFQNDNRDLRVQFMIGDIQEDDFKIKIQKREKSRQKKTDIRQVLEMYTSVVLDLFQTFKVLSDNEIIVDSLFRLRDHFNESMIKISSTYGKCAIPTIEGYFDFV